MVSAVATFLRFLFDLLAVIWYPQYLSAVSVI